ncbi:MAG: metallophosphoesterase [Verrucomicrobium sp.]|nr:metallophosphoesterase [Verrucomicrobium sp.]
MKLLVTADLHYNLKQFDWLLRQAADVDLMVLAGDFLDIGSYVSQDVQSQVVEKYFQKLKARTRVLASSGNHDIDRPEPGAPYSAQWVQELRESGIEVDGDTIEAGDVTISICPWAMHDSQRLRTLAQLREAAPKRKKLWIWVHHAPPDHTPVSWTGKQFFGEASLNDWIDELKPDLVFCGHVHQAPFHMGGSWHTQMHKTVAFNAGYEMTVVPPHLRVDLVTRQIDWFSSEGSESCEF